eukprot:2530935-Karenia_brevis.AAC.1
MGPSWAMGTKLGPSWAMGTKLRPSLHQVGTKLGHGDPGRQNVAKLGPSCAKLGPSWGQVGPSWCKVGIKLYQVGAKLRQSGTNNNAQEIIPDKLTKQLQTYQKLYKNYTFGGLEGSSVGQADA